MFLPLLTHFFSLPLPPSFYPPSLYFSVHCSCLPCINGFWFQPILSGYTAVGQRQFTHTYKHTPLLQAVKTHFSSCCLGHKMQTYTSNQSRPGMFVYCVHLNAECFMNTSGSENRAAAGKHWFTGSIRRLIQHRQRAGTCANPPNQFIQHFPLCLKSVSNKLVLSAIQYILTHFFRQPPQEPNTIPQNVKTLSKGNFTLVLGWKKQS